MGLISNIDQHKPVNGYERIGEGSYPRLKLTSIRSNDQAHFGPVIIATFEVLESSGPSASKPGDEVSVSFKKTGEQAARSLGEYRTMLTFLGNRELGASVVDLDEMAGTGALVGRLVSIPGAEKRESKNGRSYIRISWAPVADQTPIPVGGAPAPAAAPPPIPPTDGPKGPAFPPAGWTQHPSNPKYFYRGKELMTEEQLRALK